MSYETYLKFKLAIIKDGADLDIINNKLEFKRFKNHLSFLANLKVLHKDFNIFELAISRESKPAIAKQLNIKSFTDKKLILQFEENINIKNLGIAIRIDDGTHKPLISKYQDISTALLAFENKKNLNIQVSFFILKQVQKQTSIRITDEDKKIITDFGNGSFTEGLRLIAKKIKDGWL